jgi:hypothetical protein
MNERSMIMMNTIPSGSEMIGYFFRKRECFSSQPSKPLPQEGMKTLSGIGFSTVLPYRTMSRRRKEVPICGPKIGRTHYAWSIHARQCLPSSLRALPIATPESDTHALSTRGVFGQPYPLCMLFAAHNRPHVVTGHGQSAFFFGWTSTCCGISAYF